MADGDVRLPARQPALLSRHRQGLTVLRGAGLPELLTVGDLIRMLHLRSSRQLGWLLRATDQDGGPYHSFTIPKRDGSPRTICAPGATLRYVQRRILDDILTRVPVHHAAHGFVAGRSIVTNAQRHNGANLIIKFDLKDFFPSVSYYRIVGLFTKLGYPLGNARFSTYSPSDNVAPTLARLCCYTPDEHVWGSGYAPQGAPTSPCITNLICRRLDARLTGLAKKFDCVYTRYADDMTFSFLHQEPPIGRFRWWVTQVCSVEGFAVRDDKFHVARRSQRQTVTGLVVNDVVRVKREDRRKVRAILHNCRRYGLESQLRDNPDLLRWLMGYASYIHMVYPQEGVRLLTQARAIQAANP